MSMENALPIEIGSTKPMDRTNPPRLDEIVDVDLLFTSYLTDVFLLPNRLQFVVDTFRLLYGILSRIYCLQTTTSFALEVGEGLEIHGLRDRSGDEFFNIKIVNCGFTEHETKMATSRLLVSFIELASILIKSISSAGIDTLEALNKFPAALF